MRKDTFVFRMTREERTALEHLADERSTSVGSVIRWAIKRAVIEPQTTGAADSGRPVDERREVVSL